MGKIKQSKRKVPRNKGNLEVTVIDNCNSDPLENTNLEVGSLTGVTDNAGKFLFKDLLIESHGIIAEKSYPEKILPKPMKLILKLGHGDLNSEIIVIVSKLK